MGPDLTAEAGCGILELGHPGLAGSDQLMRLHFTLVPQVLLHSISSSISISISAGSSGVGAAATAASGA